MLCVSLSPSYKQIMVGLIMETLVRDNVRDIIAWENVAKLDYENDISKAEEDLALKIANYLGELGINKPSSLIELGSGSGHISAILSTIGYHVTLMDFSEEILTKSKRLFESKGLKADFICGNIFNVNQQVNKQYDVAWNSGVMEHFNTKELAQLFKVIKEITKHYYLCIVPNTESLPYLLFRHKAMKSGKWLYGMEFLRDDYEEIAKQAGFILRKKIYLGDLFTTDYIRYFFGDESSKDYQEFLEAGFLPEKENYLILYLFEKESGVRDIGPITHSACEMKTINFDYITALQKKNRELLQENAFKKFESHCDHLSSNNDVKPIANSSNIQLLINTIKKYGLFSLFKMGLRECRDAGVINSIKYFRNKVRSSSPINNIGLDNSINLIKSAIDLMHYLHQCNLIKGILFIDSAFDFDEDRNQRSIALANEFNSQGYFVFFLRYQWSEQDTSIFDFKLFKQGVMQIPRLHIDYLLSSEIIQEIALNRYFVITIPDSFLFKKYLSIRHAGIKICYDIMDSWKDFNKVGSASWYDDKVEQFFINNADVVSAVSKCLVDKLSNTREIKLISNGLFGNDNFLPFTKTTKYHVGYIGHLTEKWFNWDYIFKLAEDQRFILHIIGEGAPIKIHETIRKYSNIIFYGYVPKTNLAQYASYFNVGLIPFIDSELSHCVDPLKVYDYLQFGRPVVSTGIPHLSDYPYCVNTVNFSDFKDAIIKFSQEITIDKFKISSFLRENTWNKKVIQLIHFLENDSINGGQ